MIEILKKLYKSNQPQFKKIIKQFPDDDIAGPFLMSPNESYQNENTKVLIIGQETNGWGYFCDDIEGGMKLYEEFNLGEEYYSSPFWNVTRKVEEILTGNEFNCAWTNLSKFDVDSERPTGEYLDAISTLDGLLVEEINILKPDFVLFFTGHSMDDRIRRIFPDICFDKVKGFSTRELSHLKHADLPVNSYRTYHPRYLRQSGLEEKFIKFLKQIKN